MISLSVLIFNLQYPLLYQIYKNGHEFSKEAYNGFINASVEHASNVIAWPLVELFNWLILFPF